MIANALFKSARLGQKLVVPLRQVHKGIEGTPPMRFISVPVSGQPLCIVL